MKKLILSILTITALSFGSTAQNVHIPDSAFKAYLVGNQSVNPNGDSEIEVSEASAFDGILIVTATDVADFTGIESLTNMKRLSISNNDSITNLDISKNENLEIINVSRTNITSLDVSKNTKLTHLECYQNSMTSIDVTQNPELIQFRCHENQIESIDVSQNPLLESLEVSNNKIKTLDLSQNNELIILRAYMNQLTELDLSSHTKLIGLFAGNNLLTSLNMANGNNSNVSVFKLEDNPHLNCIQVDDAAHSTANWTEIDSIASFSTNCNACIVNIPDASFKSYLVANTAINTNGDAEIQCDEASTFTGAIFVGGYFISDLTGIEAFTSIKTLQCYNNQLTSIDLTSNIALTELRCQSNQLTSLNVANGNNTNFINFIVSDNPNLSCIQVDDATYSTTNWTDLDAGASFSTDCDAISSSFEVKGQGGVNAITVKDGTLQMTATTQPSNTPTSAVWQVQNGTGSATIDQFSGLLTAVSDGEVTVRAQSEDDIDLYGSVTITISNQSSTGIFNHQQTNAFKVYPNPAVDVLNIETQGLQIETITILNLEGKQIKQYYSNETIDVSGLSKGMYILQIQSESGIFNQRFLKK